MNMHHLYGSYGHIVKKIVISEVKAVLGLGVFYITTSTIGTIYYVFFFFNFVHVSYFFTFLRGVELRHFSIRNA